MSKKQTKDPIYVGVYDAKNVQKSLLQSSRGVIHLVKEYNSIETIRQKKLDAFKRFDKLVEDMSSLIEQLKKHLPVNAVEQPQVTPLNSSAAKAQPIDNLDKELADIERKLKKLEK